ncbi:uncharacterized protein [Eucyclogobius newberryi]|uniref:uncharacterized protein isoform X3 n=1 Tax=Eucyclogobius newberryi TaxID=166745 RepID=UPI003B5A607E
MCERSLALRALVNARLTAAAEEIFALVERTIAEYEEELCRSKEENQRNQQLLEEVLSPQLRLHRAEGVQIGWFTPDPVSEEIPEIPQIKEEPEEHFLKPEEEQLPEFTAVCVKSEEQSSLLQQRQTEHRELTQGELCGGAGADISLDPLGHLYSETEEGQAPYSCSICNDTFLDKWTLKSHKRTHKDGKHYFCSVCGKKYTHFFSLIEHNRTHTGQRPFCCPICGKSFAKKHHLKEHIRTHTGEKPYRCSVCGEAFTRSSSLKMHKEKHLSHDALNVSLQSSSAADSQLYLHRFMF